jgi:hypothetical protein
MKESKNYDVIITGAGPAGIGAALAASKMGASTLLLEASHHFGGVANKAMFMPFNRLYLKGKPRGGVIGDFVSHVLSMGKLASINGKVNFIDGDGIDIHPEYFQTAIFELLDDYQCDYKLYSQVVGVVKQDNKVAGVTVASKKGFIDYCGKVVVDATGDGDTAFFAGAEYMEGTEENGRHMPVSIVFMIGNADVEKAYDFKDNHGEKFNQYIEQARKDGYQTNVWYAYDRTTIPGAININNGGPYEFDNIDATDVDQITKVTKLGIKAAMDFVEIARKYEIPGLENCVLLRTGAAAVRDTRRFVGDYIVTLEDAEKGTNFTDVVSRKYGNIDANQIYIGKMKSGYGYPYRAMLPRNIEGLILAGRCGSSTFLGHAAGKSMGNMMEVGQAAGIAAALSAKANVLPRNLDINVLQNKIHEFNSNI